VAVWAAELGSLIEVGNRFGLFFYGSILGVFILAIGGNAPRRTGRVRGAYRLACTGGWFATNTKVAFPAANLIGAVQRRRGRHPGQRHRKRQARVTPMIRIFVTGGTLRQDLRRDRRDARVHRHPRVRDAAPFVAVRWTCRSGR
jgi:hypothetical protein